MTRDAPGEVLWGSTMRASCPSDPRSTTTQANHNSVAP